MIGSTLKLDRFISGRYLAVRFETGTAYTWRLDGFSIDVTDAGEF